MNAWVHLITFMLISSCAINTKGKIDDMVGLTKNIHPTIMLNEVGPLRLHSPSDQRGFAHFSAASGMQIIGDRLFVVADDELFLASFSLLSPTDGELIRIFPGNLAKDNTQRKKGKPDWEALALLPDNSLLFVPSGSTAARQKAALYSFSSKKTQTIDMTPLYSELMKKIKEINIEGALVIGNELRLFQRGNGSLKENAVISLKLDSFLEFVKNPKSFKAQEMISSVRFFCGDKQVGPLATFSDAAALSSGEILFVASIEDTVSTFADGEVLGSFLGLMDTEGNVKWMAPFSINIKAEGIAVREKDHDYEIYITTDPDDPSKASTLYKASISKGDLH